VTGAVFCDYCGKIKNAASPQRRSTQRKPAAATLRHGRHRWAVTETCRLAR
jgi:hypothetical protein